MQFVSPVFTELSRSRSSSAATSPTATTRALPVALINERFAKRYFAGRSPLGLHVGMGGNPGTKTDIEIVGVVKDTSYESMRDEVPYDSTARIARWISSRG